MARVVARQAEAEVRRARSASSGRDPLPNFIEPQLCLLAKDAPSGEQWVHEIKYDGYRIHARIDHGEVRLITRSGLDWSARYGSTAAALKSLAVKAAYLDGELCAVAADGTTSFSAMQAASDGQSTGDLVFYAFDLIHLDGRDIRLWPLLERKAKLASVLANTHPQLRYSEHVIGDGPAIRVSACKLGAEGVVSKRVDRPYMPGDRRGAWVKSKCLNRQEFVVVGWSNPAGARSSLGSLLLGYYTMDGRLIYAGRAGTGMSVKQLSDLRKMLDPLSVDRMPLDASPPPTSRFGSRLELSRVHWVKPVMVVEVTFLTWTGDGLLRHVVFQGVRDDKKASDVRLEKPQ